MTAARVMQTFRHADTLIGRACGALEALRATYDLSALPQDTKLARVAALDAKIDYLRGLSLNPEAHPWEGDAL